MVPTTGYEFEESVTPDEDVAYTELERIGITFWYVKSTRFESLNSPISAGTTSVEFSIVGILAILPLFIALGMLGRWLYCFLPHRYRRPDDRCDHCDYQLTGITSPVCPECGEVIT